MRSSDGHQSATTTRSRPRRLVVSSMSAGTATASSAPMAAWSTSPSSWRRRGLRRLSCRLPAGQREQSSPRCPRHRGHVVVGRRERTLALRHITTLTATASTRTCCACTRRRTKMCYTPHAASGTILATATSAKSHDAADVAALDGHRCHHQAAVRVPAISDQPDSVRAAAYRCCLTPDLPNRRRIYKSSGLDPHIRRLY